MSRLKVIFFDAAGTLFHVEGSVAQIYLAYAQKYGVEGTERMVAAVDAAFERAFHEAPPPIFSVNDPAELKQCERMWWFDVVHAVFYRVGMFEKFDEYFEEVFEAFEGARHWRLYPETLDALEAVKGRGMEVGIISNFDTRLFTVLRGLGIADSFDTVTISSLVKAAKPAPHIFRVALEKHAVEPDEAVHVGDSLRDDVQGAQQAGVVPVWLDRGSRHNGQDPGQASPAHRIHTLESLPDLVEELEKRKD